jgi:hypothetical protein
MGSNVMIRPSCAWVICVFGALPFDLVVFYCIRLCFLLFAGQARALGAKEDGYKRLGEQEGYIRRAISCN